MYDLANDHRIWHRNINDLHLNGNDAAKGLWSNGTTLWAADHEDDKLYAYNLADGARTPDHDIDNLDDAGNDRAAGIWSNGTVIWVVDDADAKVYAYNLADGAHRPELDFDTHGGAGTGSPKGIWSDGTTVWIADDHYRAIHAYPLPQPEQAQEREPATPTQEREPATPTQEPDPKTPERTPALQPLTAAFDSVPDSHDGFTAFEVRIRFSEQLKNARLGGKVVRVTNGDNTGSRRVDGTGEVWAITIAPHGGGDVVIELAAGGDECGSGMACTIDFRPLSHTLAHTVPG